MCYVCLLTLFLFSSLVSCTDFFFYSLGLDCTLLSSNAGLCGLCKFSGLAFRHRGGHNKFLSSQAVYFYLCYYCVMLSLYYCTCLFGLSKPLCRLSMHFCRLCLHYS